MSAPEAPRPHSSSRILTGGSVVGDYEILGELGRGGMGVVYRARQISLNRVVGLKMLTGHYGRDELARFLAEAETAAGLHHTNIIQVYEVGEIEGAPFFSMEYVESGSLADRLRNGPIEEREAAQLLISVARALHFAHRSGVVHRDMKPANILLDPEGVPKVADFGIAKRLTANSSLTLSGAVIGTPTYMAPEQAKGTSRDVGASADVYSLGAILYEMLSGRPPFLPEDSETALTVRVITEDAVSPAFYRPGIPRDLEIICMKCLEKEPRDRYESAAALAEDLRRFLDDESIVARPPTTAVRTVKWIRRNPWRFVAATALLFALAWGAQRLWFWEFYVHRRIEYAAAVEFVNGVLEPARRLKENERGRVPVHLRLTRSGRSGPIMLVEVLNSRGHPAVLRPVRNHEAIPLYMEGLMDAQPVAEKTPESTKIEFIYTEEKLAEVRAHDRNGDVVWRILYDREVAGASSGVVGARYVNMLGFDTASRSAATRIRIERDAQGRDRRVTFYNASGEPTPNGEGVFGYKAERDEAGRLKTLTNLNREGKPAANRDGTIALAYQWDAEGRLVRVEVRDGEGKPAVSNGVAAASLDYDSAGNVIRETRFGADGKLARSSGPNWAVLQEIGRNERGEVLSRKYFRGGENGATSLISEWKIDYDEFGHPGGIRISGAVNWGTAFRRDALGNVVEETYLDAENRPVVTEEIGYAIKRRAYEFGPQGTRWIETYFDATGAKSYGKGGYHRLITDFGPTGVLQRTIFEERDPAKYGYYRDVSLAEYDAQGNLRRNVSRSEDEKGQLAVNAGLQYVMLEQSFDENGRPFLEWEIGRDESTGAPTLSIDTEYHRTGATKRVVQQACDSERKPLPYRSTGVGARVEEEYDATNRLERRLETGFDEKVIGFNVRESKFSNGVFQSVAHKRSDGTTVEAVQVIIRAVAPAQPKAAELKVGDQLLEANGTQVVSAYHWAYSKFPGGWIEVIRGGQRVRIDGFEAGPLGIDLIDRALPPGP